MRIVSQLSTVLLALVLGACSNVVPLANKLSVPDKSALPVGESRAGVNQLRPFDGALRTRRVGKLGDPALTELSGLAASGRHSGVYYAVNDSGNEPQLFAIGPRGEPLGRWLLPVNNADWEALATFFYRGRHWLMIADVGDNLRHRASYALHFFEEPEALSQREIPFARTHRFVFEGGAQNVESVAVSAADQMIYLLAKTVRRPILYGLSLEQSLADRGLAGQQGRIASLTKTATDGFFEMMLAGHILLTPTAMDISADDRFAIVANYRHVYLYRRGAMQTWSQVLSQTRPQVISSHRLRQSEAVSFAGDGRSILLASEGRYAPVLRIAPVVQAPAHQ